MSIGVRDGHSTQGDRWSGPLVVVVLLLGLVAVSLLLRLEGLGRWLWMDEGISVGIASHRLSEIPGVLRMDGSPPLYYLLLHGWMGLFGRSELAIHSLSLVLSLALIPASLWAGWSLFGRRAGWIAAVLAATNTFVTEHAREGRMYTLVALLALVTTATFFHVFVFRRRRYIAVFAGSLLLLLYTHNWSIWFTAGLIAALVPCLWAAADRMQTAVDAACSFAVVGLLYVPWVPTLLFQTRHTGAPWSPTPLPREALSALSEVLGDTHERVLVALVLVAGAGLWQLWRRRSDDSQTASATVALVLIIAVTVGLAWLGAQARPSWASRYLMICLPPVLLLAAVGLARSGAQGVLALCLIVVIWTQPVARLTGRRPPVTAGERAAEKVLAQLASPYLGPGDLVIAIQMEEVPVLHYYLPAGVRFATPMGGVEDPRVADWRDAVSRLRAAKPADLRPLVDEMPAGSTIMLLCEVGSTDHPELTWFRLMRERCRQWDEALASDSRLVAIHPPDAQSWPSQLGRPVILLSKTVA